MGPFKQMNKRILGGLAAAAVLAGGLAITSGVAQASQVDENGEHKVWVCHATSGLGELKNGYNLIFVDVASTKDEAHLAHATTDPKNNSKFGVLFDYIDVNPNDLPGACGAAAVEPTVVTPAFTSTAPSCDAEGTALPVQAEGISWDEDENGLWTASLDSDLYVFSPGAPTQFGPFPIDKLSGEELCPTPAVVVPVTPTETPAAPTPDVVVAALPPVQAAPAVAPAQAVSPAAALPAQALPSTGIDGTGITAIIALLLTSLGGAALFVSRRFNVTN